MKTINRYILAELLKTFAFALVAMSALLVLVGLIQKAIEHNIPIDQTLRLVPFVVVEMSRISIPMTFLLATTTFFARMSGNNEVIALKSLGISPWMFLWPVMLLGVIASLTTVYLNEMAITWGRTGAAAVIYNASEDILLNQLRTTHRFSSKDENLKIMVRGVENRRLISPTFTLKDPPTIIEAKFARISIDFSKQLLTLTLNQPRVDVESRGGYSGDERIFQYPLTDILSNDSNAPKRPSDMGLDEIPARIVGCEAEINTSRRKIAAHRAFAACLGTLDLSVDYAHKYVIADNGRLLDRLTAEPPRRWATGFSCLFFIWLGAPLAIWMRKADGFASFFACFCPILLIYYPLLMFGMQGAKKGTMPPESVWIANICLGIIGFWFLKRIHRY